jgi:hypothetical protein
MTDKSAFPTTFSQHTDLGMTLRDYFAAQALQALIIREGKGTSGLINEITTTAYQYADDMLKERDE